MKKRISIYICVMMLAFSFAGCTSEQSEKKPEIELQQIKSIGEFAVLECYYTITIVNYQSNEKL